jgi:YHS domain-containing protein
MKETMEKAGNSVMKHKDPVCGMWVTKNEARASMLYNGKNYYFCSENCATKFKDDPEKYISKENEDEQMNHGSMKMGSMKKMKHGHGGCHHKGGM